MAVPMALDPQDMRQEPCDIRSCEMLIAITFDRFHHGAVTLFMPELFQFYEHGTNNQDTQNCRCNRYAVRKRWRVEGKAWIKILPRADENNQQAQSDRQPGP